MKGLSIDINPPSYPLSACMEVLWVKADRKVQRSFAEFKIADFGIFGVVSFHQELFGVIQKNGKIFGKKLFWYIKQKLIFSEGFYSSKIQHEIFLGSMFGPGNFLGFVGSPRDFWGF